MNKFYIYKDNINVNVNSCISHMKKLGLRKLNNLTIMEMIKPGFKLRLADS